MDYSVTPQQPSNETIVDKNKSAVAEECEFAYGKRSI